MHGVSYSDGEMAAAKRDIDTASYAKQRRAFLECPNGGRCSRCTFFKRHDLGCKVTSQAIRTGASRGGASRLQKRRPVWHQSMDVLSTANGGKINA